MGPDMLRNFLEPIWMKLYCLEPESVPFQRPVDPIALRIPDYFTIVKNPMDLSVIKTKLSSNRYIDPWHFIDDFNQIFENSMIYNRKTTRLYRFAMKVHFVFISYYAFVHIFKFFQLSEVFNTEISIVMNELGYCCGRKHNLSPQMLLCNGKDSCIIPKNAHY